MKKIFLIFLISLAFLFLGFSQAPAAQCPPAGDPAATGIVPCGVSCECTISNFFTMLARIFNFVMTMIVAPLAVLMLVIGGVLILVSAGNPGLATKGKQTLYMAILGLFLAFGSWVIINFILQAIGYTGNWNQLY